ncbi:MAG TPA: hypothetical protein VJ862_02525 [Rhodanobacteraceae bacterium]|nr:hypothetical protein [Rhodanobacteraceae bacterium]
MIGFFIRLKQRKVVQWSIAYVACAFSLIQVADVVAGSYGLPHLVMHLVFGVLSLGLVVAVLVAWYHGERGAQRVSGPELLLIALVLAIGGGLLWYFAAPRLPVVAEVATAQQAPAATAHAPAPAVASSWAASPPLPATAAAEPIPVKSIAVLPFKNLSEDARNAYFAAGIQDLILTKLGDIGGLRVVSRTSTERYASNAVDVKSIARELGTATLLEGSVQKSGNTVLVNVQLVDALADHQLWAASYTRTLSNVFGVEGEVAQQVATALKTHLDTGEAARTTALPTRDPEAYDLFLRAVSLLNSGNNNFDLGKMRQSFPLFARAVAVDPQFALALARWSYAESLVAFLGQGEDAPRLEASAQRHAQQALSLQPRMAAAQLAMGWSDYWGRQDFAGASKWFEAVLKTQPYDIEAMQSHAMTLRRTGRIAAAMREMQSALALDPANPSIISDVAETAAMMRRYGDAARTYRLALEQGKDTGWARVLFARSIVCAGGGPVLAERVASGDEPVMQLTRVWLLTLRREWRAAIALLETVPDRSENFGLLFDPKEVQLARLHRYAGNGDRARELYRRMLPGLRDRARTPRKGLPAGWQLMFLAEAEIGAGDARAAIAAGQDALARARQGRDHLHGPMMAVRVAAIFAQANRADLALPLLEQEMANEGGGLAISPALLRTDPAWDPISKDPRFLALLEKYPVPAPQSAAAMLSASRTPGLAYDD